MCLINKLQSNLEVAAGLACAWWCHQVSVMLCEVTATDMSANMGGAISCIGFGCEDAVITR